MSARTDAQAPAPVADRLADWLVCAPLFFTTFFGKWALFPDNVRGVGLPMMLVMAALVFGLATRRLRFDRSVLAAYLGTVALLGTLQVVGAGQFSIGSLALMVVTYFYYVVRADEDRVRRLDPLAVFTDLAAFVALCGLAQFGGQFLLPKEVVFPVEHILPNSMLLEGYNMIIPISFGSPIYKSNGIFCLEPSFFSQLLALAILVELCTRNRPWRLALFAAGMVVSYSGTGILLLAICLPILVITRRRFDLLVYGVVFLAIALSLADVLNLDVFTRRLGEFSESRGSSGFDRFVGGFYVLDDYLWKDLGRSLVGFGAGTYASFTERGMHSAAEMAFFKVVFEYGLIGSPIYFGFLIYAIGRCRAPGVIRLAALLEFFLSNFYVMTPHGLALTLLVWGYRPGVVRAPDDWTVTRTVVPGGLASRPMAG